jgi:predicted PurR-regulated permease PerM
MDSKTIKFKKSTVTALVALGFLGWLFCLSLATPDIFYDVVYAGILISSALTVYYWRKERKTDAKTSPVGIWIVLAVFLLFIVFCLLLPAL